MIRSLNEIQAILLARAEEETDPIFQRPYRMFSPGCSSEKIKFLKEKLTNISNSYLDIIMNYSLNGVIIDNFEMSPYSFKDSDSIDGIINAYEDPFFPKEFMRKHKMYQIGSYNTDILCVTEGTEHFSEGEILYIDEGYDIYNPEDEQIHPLAKDFEQFLIVAGNLDEIHTQMQGDDALYEGRKAEFLERLERLGVDKKYHEMWLSFL